MLFLLGGLRGFNDAKKAKNKRVFRLYSCPHEYSVMYQTNPANKITSNRQGLLNFAVSLVKLVFHFPDVKVKFGVKSI